MLFFGHIGITAAVIRAGDIFLSRAGSVSGLKAAASIPTGAGNNKSLRRKDSSGIATVPILNLDYRLVLIGSMLPDIIDKPIFLLFREVTLSGRAYAHTLFFSFVLISTGLVLLRFRKPALLAMGLSSFIHITLDRMWANPITLFWPILGPMAAGERDVFFSNIFQNVLKPEVYIPEILGLAVLIYFGVRLADTKSAFGFIKAGRLE